MEHYFIILLTLLLCGGLPISAFEKPVCSVDNGKVECSCSLGYESKLGDQTITCTSCTSECTPGFAIKYTHQCKGICVDIDECTVATACGENERCKNTVGSYLCKCPRGSVLYGKSCQNGLLLYLLIKLFNIKYLF